MTEWRKSSFSGVNTNCVEVAWRKSSFSGGNTNCVEVAVVSSRVGVRDSKSPERSLTVPSNVWRLFVFSLD
jgi:hypothetical protein